MGSRGSYSRQGEPRRPWRVPPALDHDAGAELLEGMGVLREFGGQPLASILWEAGREVVLWAGVEERAGLFTEEAYGRRIGVLRKLDVPAEVAPLLRALAEAVLMEPERADADYVALLCRQISGWAMEAGAGETALWYAQAASAAAPARSRAALLAGSAALRIGKLQRAQSWLRRAVGLARKREWDVYCLAYVELARVAEQRGDRESARRRFLSAVRASRRHGFRDVRGSAMHGLVRLAVDDGALMDAERYASAARKCFGPGHPDRMALDVDLAAMLVRSGRSARGLELIRHLLTVVGEPGPRMYLLALQALAHAQKRDAGALAASWPDAWDYAHAHDAAGWRVRALLTLATAARAGGRPRHVADAEAAARSAVRTAPDRWLVERHAAGADGASPRT